MSEKLAVFSGKQPPDERSFCFADWRLDAVDHLLYCNGTEVPLAPRALSVLEHLLERAGRVVSKDELLQAVWGDAYVTEDSLTHAVSVIRQTLGDDPQKPRYIQTLSRRGYRFIGEVTILKGEGAHLKGEGAHAAADVSGAGTPTRTESTEGAAGPDALAVPRRSEGVAQTVVSEAAGHRLIALPPGLTWVLSLALVAVIVWGAALVMTDLRGPPEQSPGLVTQRFVETLPEAQPAWADAAVFISPGGRRFLYRSPEVLLTRPVDRPGWTVLPGTEEAHSPTFSPDGDWIAFATEESRLGSLWRINVNGGPPQLLCKTGRWVRNLQWEPDGYVYFSDFWGRLLRVAEGGGAPQLVIDLDGEFRAAEEIVADFAGLSGGLAGPNDTVWGYPQVLADGAYLLVAERPWRIGPTEVVPADEGRILLFDTASGDVSTLLEGPRWARYLSTGHLVYPKTNPYALWARPFDLESLRVGEPEVKLAQFDGDFHVSETGTGTLAYYDWDEAGPIQVVWFDRQGQMTTAMEVDSTDCLYPSLSTDGEKLLLSCVKNDQWRIYLVHLSRQMVTSLVLEGESSRAGKTFLGTPIWSPGDRGITYSVIREGNSGIYQVRYDGFDGFGDPELLLERQNPVYPQVWSPDGRWLAFLEEDPETKDDIWLLAVDPPGEPIPFVKTAADERVALLTSPDGRWLAYATRAEVGDDFHIYLASVPDAEVKKQITSVPGGWAVWAREGRELFYLTGLSRQLMSVEFPDGTEGVPETPRILFDVDEGFPQWTARGMTFDVAPGGERIITIVRPRRTASRLHFVVNWFEELKRLAPAGQ